MSMHLSQSLPTLLSKCCISCALMPSQIPLPENRITNSTPRKAAPRSPDHVASPVPWASSLWAGGCFYRKGWTKARTRGSQASQGGGLLAPERIGPHGRGGLKLQWGLRIFCTIHLSLWTLLPIGMNKWEVPISSFHPASSFLAGIQDTLGRRAFLSCLEHHLRSGCG